MLENDQLSHNETIENEDVNLKYESIGQYDKKQKGMPSKHQHKDGRQSKTKTFYDELEREKENFLNIKNTVSVSDHYHENTTARAREDLSDCSSKDDSKPAKKTLKKTFTSLLSKIQLGKLPPDGSSVTDTEDSNCDKPSK